VTHRVRPLAPDRPTVAEVLADLRPFWGAHGDRDPLYCCLHVQLGDGNLADNFFDADARMRAAECKHAEHLALFDKLTKMSVTQRKKLVDRMYKADFAGRTA